MGQTSMRTLKQVVALGAVIASAASCGDVVRTGRAPVMLVINSVNVVRGVATGAGTPASGPLLSDVITMVTSPAPCTVDTPCPTVFDDLGRADVQIIMKDQGTATAPVTPSANNWVTITRVHVKYVRADGRNVQGVDVPYEFDASVSATASPSATFGFELVRHAAKQEPPLVALITQANVISTIAELTFYGTDQVGNAVTATSQVQVNFGNFGDTQ